MIQIFRKIEDQEKLVVGADPGESISYAAGVIISKKHNDVPIIYHARVESPRFGEELHKLGLYCNTKTGEFPLLAIERNIGAATIEKVRNLGYPLHRLYRQKTIDRVTNTEEERIGWVTTASNRRYMLDELAMRVRKEELKIYSKEIISEMLTFVVHERTGQPRPERGSYSDLIMALAIGSQMLKIDTGGGKWAQKPRKRSNRFLPDKAEGFINETYDPNEHRDWRSM
jgi:hypothetical protein